MVNHRPREVRVLTSNLLKLSTSRWPRWARTIIVAICLVVIGIFAWKLDWPPVLAAIGQAQMTWILAALLMGSGSIALRALRLALLTDDPRRFPAAFWSYSLGYLGTLFLPLGSGEMVRVVALKRMTDLTLTLAATSAIVDRLFDLLGMGVVLSLLLGRGIASNLRTGPLFLLGALTTILLVSLLSLVLGGRWLRTLLRQLDPSGNQPRIQTALAHFDAVHSQILRLSRPGRISQVIMVQVFIISADAMAVWLALLAFPFGHGLDILAPLRINLFLMFATALPLLPGNFGTHQVVCIFALRPYGISQAQALAFSLVAQVSSAIWLALQGLLALTKAPAHILSQADGDNLISSTPLSKEQP